jgi:hypothetical protein
MTLFSSMDLNCCSTYTRISEETSEYTDTRNERAIHERDEGEAKEGGVRREDT